MKVSYTWLQEYIEEPLPEVSKVAEALTMHSFEVEGIEEVEEDGKKDSLLDVKILPNRTHDCLSHYGIASEIAGILGLTRKPLLPLSLSEINSPAQTLSVSIETEECIRAVKILISGIKVGESPDWLKTKLRVLGQRPINNIVDITNYLMLSFGQPMHAFDAHKIAEENKQKKIIIRHVQKGEKITLLNNKEYDLDPSVMVISDTEKALDVAGVMGGKDSSISESTTDIILSFSSFNAVSIRKASKMLGLRTDASHRFENEISSSLIDRVIPYALKYISLVAGGVVVERIDVYPHPEEDIVVEITGEKVSSRLGVLIDEEKIIEILKRQNIAVKKVEGKESLLVTPPRERLDLSIPEAIAGEVGRLFGYENIPAAEIPPTEKAVKNKIEYVANTIRNTLTRLGFSEVYTYAFTEQGEVELENPLAGDKKFLRGELATGIARSLDNNFKFLDLLGLHHVKIFEIGKVFKKEQEKLHLAIGVKLPKSKKNDTIDYIVAEAITKIEDALLISIGDISIVGGVAEIDIDNFLSEVASPLEDVELDVVSTVSYKPISPYPFAVRDVAVFVPSTTPQDDVEKIIQQHLSPIVVRFSLFDVFTKVSPEAPEKSKTSYAFRLIFQSLHKTLTEEEINAVLRPIYESLKAQEEFEVR